MSWDKSEIIYPKLSYETEKMPRYRSYQITLHTFPTMTGHIFIQFKDIRDH